MPHRIPLLLLPGLCCDHGLWDAQLMALADIANMQVGDTLQDDSLAAMASRILDAAPAQFALAGLSMGGYLAMEIMRRAGGRVTRLALLDTSARHDTAEQTTSRLNAISAASRYDFAALARTSLTQLVAHDAPQSVRDAVVEMSVRVGAETYIRQQHAIMARPDSRPGLGAIHVPTIVVVGERDALTPPALAEEIAGLIPGATLHRIPGSGHLSPMEAPVAVTHILRDWLTAHD